MENSLMGRESIGVGKFSGLAVAVVIVLLAIVIPAIPSWVGYIAVYPFFTSIVDIVLFFRH